MNYPAPKGEGNATLVRLWRIQLSIKGFFVVFPDRLFAKGSRKSNFAFSHLGFGSSSVAAQS